MSFARAGINQVVSPLAGLRDTGLSDLGNYFTASTPTPGTGVVGGTSVNTFVETTPTLVLYNAGPSTIYPTMLRTHLSVVGVNAGAVLDFWTFTMDNGNRYTSGGTQLTVVNANGLTTTKSGAFVFVGGITATANTPKRRIVANIQTKTDVIEVVHDTMVFSWGDTFGSSADSLASNAGVTTYPGYAMPPIALPPNTSLVVVRWAVNQTTGSTHEYLMGWYEK